MVGCGASTVALTEVLWTHRICSSVGEDNDSWISVNVDGSVAGVNQTESTRSSSQTAVSDVLVCYGVNESVYSNGYCLKGTIERQGRHFLWSEEEQKIKVKARPEPGDVALRPVVPVITIS